MSQRREPKPFFRKQTSSWYVQLNGRQVPLGRDREAAFKQYHGMMLGRQETPNVTAAELLDQFLDWCKEHQAARTYQFHYKPLQGFIDFLGKAIRAADVKPFHLTQWLKTVNGGATHKHNCERAVKRAFQWGADEKYIVASPVAGKRRYAPQSRKVYLTPDQWQTILNSVSHRSFRDLLIFMRQTGCRPQELRKIEARHVEGNCVVFPAAESKGGKEERVIQLTPIALEIVQRLTIQWPQGVLFRTRRGTPWTHPALGRAFRYHAKKLGLPLYAYAIRHTFLTDLVESGEFDAVTLSGIMGHTDLKMIMKVYNHANKKRAEVGQRLDRCINANDVEPPLTDRAA